MVLCVIVKNKERRMVKPRQTAHDAKGVTISLTPEEELALNTIVLRRRKRGDQRATRNGVVADALWHYLIEVEKVPRSQIERLFPQETEKEKIQNVTPIRKNGDKI
jgi:hypothetical protein